MELNKLISYVTKEKYKEAEDLLKEEIEKDSNNADNYYYLFLVSNKDYSSMDFNNLSNELYFNKALELGTKEEKKIYENEFNFYKCLTPIMRKLFCYVCRNNINLFEKEFKKIDSIDIVYGDNASFFEYLKSVVLDYNTPFNISMGYYLINLFYNKYNTNEKVNEYCLNEMAKLKNKSKNFSYISLGILKSYDKIISHIIELIPIIKKNYKDGEIIDMKDGDIFDYKFNGAVITKINNAEDFEEIIIPEGVVEIEQDVFSNCSNLKVLSLPKSLKRIGINFTNCLDLKDVYFNGTLADWCQLRFGGETTFYKDANPMLNADNFYIVDEKGDKVFNGKMYRLLEELVIPKSIKLVDTCVFCGFRCLKKIIISSNVTRIGRNSFKNCINLDELIIEKGVNMIRINAFDGCNISRIIYEGTADDWKSIMVAGEKGDSANYNSVLVDKVKALYVIDEKGYIDYNGKKYKNIK